MVGWMVGWTSADIAGEAEEGGLCEGEFVIRTRQQHSLAVSLETR
jgi:hypothetical protein